MGDARHGIEDVFAHYALAFDENEPKRYELVFADDAELIAAGNTLSGRAAIVEMMTSRIGVRREAGQQVRHVITNVLVEEESETRAKTRAYFTLIVTEPDGSIVPERCGWYLDDFVRTADGWRIARHEMH